MTGLSCGTAFAVWDAGSIVLWVIAAILAGALAYRTARDLFNIPLVVGLLLISPNTALSIIPGQLFMLVLVLLLAALWLLPDHPRVAGMIIALASLIQVFPGLLLIYARLTRQWRVVQGAIIVGIVSIPVMVWFATGSLLPAPLGILHNGSWAVALPWNDAITRIPLVGMLLVVLVLMTWAWTAYHQVPTLNGYGWTIATWLLVSPVLNVVYFVWLIPVLAMLRGRRALVAASGYLLVTFLWEDTSTFIVWVPLLLLALWIVVGSPLASEVFQKTPVFRIIWNSSGTGCRTGLELPPSEPQSDALSR